MRRLRLAAGIVLAFAGSAAAEDFRRLRGPEIASRLAGMEFTDETHWSFTFRKDGSLVSFSLGRSGTGTWRADSDRLCTQGGPGAWPCHEIWTRGRELELRRDGVDPERGILTRPLVSPSNDAK